MARTTLDRSKDRARNNSQGDENSGSASHNRSLSKVSSFLKQSVENLFCKAPVYNEKLPLTVYFHKTVALKQVIRELETAGDDSDTQELIENMHQCQCAVLDSLENIYEEGKFYREPRDYRAKFPTEVRDELQSKFWETLLFAAELIADGRVLEGREEATVAIQPAAAGLCEAFEACSRVLRAQAKRNPMVYNTPKVVETLRHFDMSWIHFEYLYVHAVMPCKTLLQYDEKMHMTVMFSEAVMRGLKNRTITVDQMEYYDPQVMFTIPRLAVLSCVLLNPNTAEGYSLLKPYTKQLDSIKLKVSRLNSQNMRDLENSLSATEDINIERTETMQDLFVAISDISDRMQSGDTNQDYRDIMSTLFKMYEDIPHPLADHISTEESESTNEVSTDFLRKSTFSRNPSIDTIEAKAEFRRMSKEIIGMCEESRSKLVRCLSIDTDVFDGAEGVDRSFNVLNQQLKDLSMNNTTAKCVSSRLAPVCNTCTQSFSLKRRRHQCTQCSQVFCINCVRSAHSWREPSVCRKCNGERTEHNQSMPTLFSQLSLEHQMHEQQMAPIFSSSPNINHTANQYTDRLSMLQSNSDEAGKQSNSDEAGKHATGDLLSERFTALTSTDVSHPLTAAAVNQEMNKHEAT
eukprot:CFRG1706T1